MTYEKIAKLLAVILAIDADDIDPDMALTAEAGVEKIQLAKLIISCEKQFGITIRDEHVHGFRTLRDLAGYIENALWENDGNAAESSEEERLGWYYA